MTALTSQINLAIAILFLACGQAAGQSGSVSGFLVDPNGRPIAGGDVQYAQLPKLARSETGEIVRKSLGTSGLVKSDSRGAFIISGLPGRQIWNLRGW